MDHIIALEEINLVTIENKKIAAKQQNVKSSPVA
jgi:hypothetical protein